MIFPNFSLCLYPDTYRIHTHTKKGNYFLFLLLVLIYVVSCLDFASDFYVHQIKHTKDKGMLKPACTSSVMTPKLKACTFILTRHY